MFSRKTGACSQSSQFKMLHTNSPASLTPEITDLNNGEFVLTRSTILEDPNGSIDRSSASPSNADDLNELMEDEVATQELEETRTIETRVNGLEAKFDYIQHQLASIMRHLHAPVCTCLKCSKTHQNTENPQNTPTDATGMLSKLFPNASTQQLKTLLDLSKMNKLPSQVVREADTVVATPSVTASNSGDLKLGQMYSTTSGGGKIQTERHSEPRKNPRKFPLPVSAYYQRKENLVMPSTPLSSIPNIRGAPANPSATASLPSTPTILPSSLPPPVTSTVSPGPSCTDGSDDSTETPNGDVPAANPNLFTQSMVDMLKLNAQNAAHSTGSPGFLRGRGRGRPKLIGDELDADLVDYMVSLKNSDPHGGHFTASQALHMARQYILERAPGLLEEHGGHVKLKLTWAMKLVSRIGERQKEIEFGLPAGTLSNMGRNLTNLPGGNFMADVMAQNIFSQHMMMVNQQISKPTTTTTSGSSATSSAALPVKIVKEEVNGNNGFHQNEENLKQEVPTMAEIVNIKELNIPFLNNFLAELNEKNGSATVIDGEIGTSGQSFNT